VSLGDDKLISLVNTDKAVLDFARNAATSASVQRRRSLAADGRRATAAHQHLSRQGKTPTGLERGLRRDYVPKDASTSGNTPPSDPGSCLRVQPALYLLTDGSEDGKLLKLTPRTRE
jgi:hypothetical protein